jgi:hypothetical protein
MINKNERTKLQRILKNSFIADVQYILDKKNIRSKKGVSFSKGFISHVFNGKYSNDAIELAIYEVYKERKTQQAKMSVLKNEILE